MGIKQEEYYLFKYKPFKEFSWMKSKIEGKIGDKVAINVFMNWQRRMIL